MTQTSKKRASPTGLEDRTIEGESPVGVAVSLVMDFSSKPMHVKRRPNLGRPLSKTKYSLSIDSE